MSVHPGILLRDAREMGPLSLRECARKAKLSASFLSDVERGARVPSPAALDRIANALDVSRGQMRRAYADFLCAETRARWTR